MAYYYSDIDINLETQADGDVTRDLDIDAVKNSITNIVQTKQGSRRMLPEFANALYSLLFEPIDEITAQEIGESLIREIERWDDRVIVDSLDITAYPDQNKYKCLLTFTIKSLNTTKTVDFVLKTE